MGGRDELFCFACVVEHLLDSLITTCTSATIAEDEQGEVKLGTADSWVYSNYHLHPLHIIIFPSVVTLSTHILTKQMVALAGISLVSSVTHLCQGPPRAYSLILILTLKHLTVIVVSGTENLQICDYTCVIVTPV